MGARIERPVGGLHRFQTRIPLSNSASKCEPTTHSLTLWSVFLSIHLMAKSLQLEVGRFTTLRPRSSCMPAPFGEEGGYVFGDKGRRIGSFFELLEPKVLTETTSVRVSQSTLRVWHCSIMGHAGDSYCCYRLRRIRGRAEASARAQRCLDLWCSLDSFGSEHYLGAPAAVEHPRVFAQVL